MTHEELRECLRKAQEYQTAAFTAKKVTINVEAHHFFSINDLGLAISVFYGESNELYRFDIGKYTKPEDARMKFAIVDTIIRESEEYTEPVKSE